MYIANAIAKIADKLVSMAYCQQNVSCNILLTQDENLHEVSAALDAESDTAEEKLQNTFDQLQVGPCQFINNFLIWKDR